MVTKSEDVLGDTWNRCLADSAIKIGAGIAVGGVLSLIVFKRKKWPVIFGTGIGLGMGLSNCQQAFNEPHAARLQRLKLKQKLPDEGEKKEP